MEIPTLESCMSGYRIVIQHLWMYNDQYMSALKTAGALLSVYLLISRGPQLIQQTSLISPIFTVQCIIVTCGLLVIVWKKFSKDFKGTAFRSVKLANMGGKMLWHNFLSLKSDNQHKIQNRKIIRMMVMFVIIRSCLEPTFPLFALLVFVFYLTSADFLKFQMDQIANFFASLPGIGEFIPLDEMQSSPSQPSSDDNAERIDGNSEVVLGTLFILKTQIIKHLPLIGTTLKLVISFSWLAYFLTFSMSFMFCIYTFVSVSQKTLEYHLITLILAHEFDGGILATFEGMEQYYIIGGMAAIEAVMTLTFMVWVLIKGHPILMLIALYTNVYCGGYDTFNFIITPIAYERAFLANFEKIPGSALQSDEESCPICLSRMGIARKTRCGHLFHGHCLRKLISHGKVLCPLCRSPLP